MTRATKPARKPRYRAIVQPYMSGWEWVIKCDDELICEGVPAHHSHKRSAQAAARRLLAAIKAGDVDETEIA